MGSARGLRCRRTLGPATEPFWVQPYSYPLGDHWAAMLVGDEVSPPDPGTVTGLTFLGATPEEAEREAKAYLGWSEPAN
jgi:hypothetical protein